MDFDILTYTAGDDRKQDTTKRDERNRASIKCHVFENKVDHRHQDRYLRKSSRDKRPTQLIHSPKYLQGKLLDSSEHKARRKNQSKWQSSNQVWIARICRQEICHDKCYRVDSTHDDHSRSHKFSIFFFELSMFRIFLFFFDLTKSFDSQHIQSQISQRSPDSKIFENRRIISISQRSKIRSHDFDRQKSKQRTNNPSC